jgi:Zn-dependent oligopeptidase
MLSSLFKATPHFEVDNNTFTEAQIRATFYPKFENEKSDQEVSPWDWHYYKKKFYRGE